MQHKIIIIDINESFIVQAEELDHNPGSPDVIEFSDELSLDSYLTALDSQSFVFNQSVPTTHSSYSRY